MSFGFSLSDFVALPEFAWRVYKACRDSASEFVELSDEILLLHNALSELKSLASRAALPKESQIRLATALKGCQESLEAIESRLLKYKSLGTKKKRIRDRVGWGMNGIGETRNRLVSHFVTLNLFSATLVSSLQANSTEQGIQQPGSLQEKTPLSFRPVCGLHRGKYLEKGIVQPCMRCKLLDLDCTSGSPCAACSCRAVVLKELPCRRGPLKSLARDLIPGFFLPDPIQDRPELRAQQSSKQAMSNHPIKLNCGLIELDLLLGASYRHLNSTIALETPQAMRNFQQTFPDVHRFRVRLINQALHYETFGLDSHSVIAAARQFLVLSLIISHNPRIRSLKPLNHLSVAERCAVRQSLTDEVHSTLRVLLEGCLKGLLERLQVLITRKNRRDWASICFSLCLLFFAAESMQVDIHLRSSKPYLLCESMEKRSILVLAEAFKQSTGGLNPLALDWENEENWALVENDSILVEAFQDLQALSQDYWWFLVERKNMEYDHWDTDCFTGKLVAQILH